jgi:non-ribosomal peptide synthetase component F
LLYRYSGQEDIIVGADIANRTHKETEPLIGFFVNQIALRTDLSGNPTFRELLNRVKEVSLGAFAHQDVPFEKVVEALKIKREVNRSLLFQVIFSLQNAPMQPLELPGLTLHPEAGGFGTAKYDLLLNMWESGDVLLAGFGYNTDLFEVSSIRQMGGHYLNLLRGLPANIDTTISELPMISEEEDEAMRQSFNISL